MASVGQTFREDFDTHTGIEILTESLANRRRTRSARTEQSTGAEVRVVARADDRHGLNHILSKLQSKVTGNRVWSC